MRPVKKKARQTAKAVDGLRELLIAMGRSADEVDKAFDSVPMTADEKMLQAEATLLHLASPIKFVSKKCKECKEPFGTSYNSVSYCSDGCRAKSLERQTGIRWNYHIDRYQNLRAEAPLVIRPEAYKQLLEFAHAILNQNGIVVEESLDQTENSLEEVEVQENQELLQENVQKEYPQLNGDFHTNLETEPPQLNGFSLPDLENLSLP